MALQVEEADDHGDVEIQGGGRRTGSEVAVPADSSFGNVPVLGSGSFPDSGAQPVPRRRLTFAADIVVGVPPRLVIDTKYAPAEVRNQYGGRSFHNDHVYQALFYGVSLGCPALLVYPRADRDVDVTFELKSTPVSIVTVDLAEPGLTGLLRLAERVHDLRSHRASPLRN